MTRRPPTTETHVLRTILSAGMLAVLLLACAGAEAGVGAGAEWHVYPGGSIQATVNAASSGDTIYVHAGAYTENVDVWKRVTLIGDGADVVTVQAASVYDHVFDVTVDWVNISGFAVTGATHRYGIYLYYVDHCNISNNNASNDWCGIYLHYSSSNTMSGNTVDSNNGNGIYLYYSNNNALQNNNATNSNKWCGVQLDYSNNNVLQNNTVNSNNVDGIFLRSSSNNNLMNNNASNNLYGIRLYESSNYNTLAGNAANSNSIGIFFNSSNNNTLSKNNASSNSGTGISIGYSNSNNLTNNIACSNIGTGISISYSSNDTITNNIASLNSYGFGIFSSSNNNTLTNNNASLNYYGIYLYSSSNNTLIGNTVSDNSYGTYLRSSSDGNTAYHNNLINNTYLNAYDECSNQWDSGSEGNYWSDYTGTDTDGNGIGNTPYYISGGSVDRYPLMQPWEEPTELTVHNLNTGENFATIQAAIDAASSGDEVHVDSGTYYENVNVNKQLTLRGIDTGSGMPVVDAIGNGNAISIAIASDGSMVEGFSATNIGRNYAGIEVASHNNEILNNMIYDGPGNGIVLLSSSINNTIVNNTLTNNWFGIELEYSNSNIIRHNTLLNNGHDVWVRGYDKFHYDNIIDTTNLVNGKPVYYYFDQHNILLDGIETSHLTLACSSNITIENSKVIGGDGIKLAFTNKSIVKKYVFSSPA